MKHLHIVGIAGKATSGIAVTAKEAGYKVTGSDIKCQDPAKSRLEEAGIEVAVGGDADLVKAADIVVVGGSTAITNPNNNFPDYTYIREHDVETMTFPDFLNEVLIHEESVVVAGSYGKSTTTAALVHCYKKLDINISYMFGANSQSIPKNLEFRSDDTEKSIIEGDEYPASKGIDNRPKFMLYEPKYTIITSAMHDHKDVYETEQSYIDAFKDLAVETIRNEGQLYMCLDGINMQEVADAVPEAEIIWYGVQADPIVADPQDNPNPPFSYIATDIETADMYTYFTVLYEGNLLDTFKTRLIGNHNIENMTAVIAKLHQEGFALDNIVEALATFSGIQRRLEVKGRTDNNSIIIDDFAHTPTRIKSSIDAVKNYYDDRKVICIYKSRSTDRSNRENLKGYDTAFEAADRVILPRMQVDPNSEKENRIYVKDYLIEINKSSTEARYLPKDEDIVKLIESEKDAVFLMMAPSSWEEIFEKVNFEN